MHIILSHTRDLVKTTRAEIILKCKKITSTAFYSAYYAADAIILIILIIFDNILK